MSSDDKRPLTEEECAEWREAMGRRSPDGLHATILWWTDPEMGRLLDTIDALRDEVARLERGQDGPRMRERLRVLLTDCDELKRERDEMEAERDEARAACLRFDHLLSQVATAKLHVHLMRELGPEARSEHTAYLLACPECSEPIHAHVGVGWLPEAQRIEVTFGLDAMEASLTCGSRSSHLRWQDDE